MNERRIETRALCADLVTLGWFENSGKSNVTAAVLEDISSRGACLQTDSPLPLNVQGFIQHEAWIIGCRISYCTYREIGYYVGVMFDADARWSTEDFRPQHLLDLSHFNTSESCMQ